MIDRKKIAERFKTVAKAAAQKSAAAFDRALKSPAVRQAADSLRWGNLRPRLVRGGEIVAAFTREQPKTAAFIYVCLFCAFSIGFLDEPFAAARLSAPQQGNLSVLADLNPSGWWFLILAGLWLFYMAVAGLSLTTDVFEKNMVKARAVLFVLLTLTLSSGVTLALNIVAGRYTPEFLDTMHLYGFSAFRFRVSETSFPSFAVQSLWAVVVAAASFWPKIRWYLYALAALTTLSTVIAAQCFISDAVMGTYIGVMMYFVARWIVSENRENIPLISL